jgi:predicted transcriptional regulator
VAPQNPRLYRTGEGAGLKSATLEQSLDDQPDPLVLASEIVASYVGNNAIPPSEVPGFIARVHKALQGAASHISTVETKARPAVDIDRSVTEDHIVCLEDGAKLKMLKRYLRTQFGLTPEQYRRKWGLPDDYPMTAPSYSRTRSRLAREMGLGQAEAAKPSTPSSDVKSRVKRAAGRRSR